MASVAARHLINEELLVPRVFWTDSWQKKYPENLSFIATTRYDVFIERPESPTGINLFVPITGPPKRGSPSPKRKIRAMEKLARKIRRNAGN